MNYAQQTQTQTMANRKIISELFNARKTGKTNRVIALPAAVRKHWILRVELYLPEF